MTEIKVKKTDGTFATITDVDIENGVEIVGIPEAQEWTLRTESSNGSETTDFVGEKSTREEER